MIYLIICDIFSLSRFSLPFPSHPFPLTLRLLCPDGRIKSSSSYFSLISWIHPPPPDVGPARCLAQRVAHKADHRPRHCLVCCVSFIFLSYSSHCSTRISSAFHGLLLASSSLSSPPLTLNTLHAPLFLIPGQSRPVRNTHRVRFSIPDATLFHLPTAYILSIPCNL